MGEVDEVATADAISKLRAVLLPSCYLLPIENIAGDVAFLNDCETQPEAEVVPRLRALARQLIDLVVEPAQSSIAAALAALPGSSSALATDGVHDVQGAEPNSAYLDPVEDDAVIAAFAKFTDRLTDRNRALHN